MARKLHWTTWNRNCHAISKYKTQTFDIFSVNFVVFESFTLFHRNTKAIWLNSNDKMYWTMWCISIWPSTIDTKRAFSNGSCGATKTECHRLLQKSIVWSLLYQMHHWFAVIIQFHSMVMAYWINALALVSHTMVSVYWIDRDSYVRLFACSFTL